MTSREPLSQIEARRQSEARRSVAALIVADAMTEFLADTMARADVAPRGPYHFESPEQYFARVVA